MKLKLLTILVALGFIAYLPAAYAEPVVGEKAPEFTTVDTNGVEHSLGDFKGKNVVLEWTNHECPFVRKHYDSGNMQKIQKSATEDGAVWLTILSSAKGKQGHLSAEEANKLAQEEGAHATARLLDEGGEIGKLYGAKTTPHMFVIDKDGMLAYAGAIDSDDSFKPETIKSATNYVTAALESLKGGEEIKVASSKPYGCGVKY